MAAFSRYLSRWFRKSSAARRHMEDEFPDTGGAALSMLNFESARKKTKGTQLPGFLASAIDRPNTQTARSASMNARLLLRDLFTPAQPVTQRNRFAGRLDVLAKLIEILEEQRSHVVVYGERGIGKTSLMHILADLARESQYIVAYESCGADSRFDEIFRSVLRDVPLLYLSTTSPMSAEAEAGATLADKLPQGNFNSRELSDLCARITGTRIIIILDEYDRVEDARFRQSVAELIKNLSDRAARVQIVLAGVSSNLQELIGYIPSIRRNIVGLPMPRLTSGEVQSLIGIGEKASGMRFEERVISMIELLANGSPYLVRLLSHHSAMKALDDGRMSVEMADIRAALEKAVEEAEARVAPQGLRHIEAIVTEPQSAFIGAVARAASTPDGWFSQANLADNLPPALTGIDTRAELLALSQKDHLLQADLESDPPRFRFYDEALPTYLWMRVARDHLASGGDAGTMVPITRLAANAG